MELRQPGPQRVGYLLRPQSGFDLDPESHTLTATVTDSKGNTASKRGPWTRTARPVHGRSLRSHPSSRRIRPHTQRVRPPARRPWFELGSPGGSPFRSVRTRCEHPFVSGQATILHADLDAFYASVEQRDDPRLRGRPVIVGPGVVLAASYEARACGVRSAMGATQARRLCPQAVVVSARWDGLRRRQQGRVRGLRGDGAGGREAVHRRGVSRRAGHRALPRLARPRSRRGCAARCGSGWAFPSRSEWPGPSCSPRWPAAWPSPTACSWCRPTGELDFLHPLGVQRLWGIGPATAGKLEARGITTVGQAARLPEAALISIVGRASGRRLHALAHNRNVHPVRVRRGRRSFGAQSALGPLAPVAGRARLRARGLGRPRDAAHALVEPGGPHRGAAPSLRRLLTGHEIAHPRAGHGRERDHPHHPEGTVSGGRAADRPRGAHPPRRDRDQPRRERRCRAAGAAAGSTRAAAPSTACSTTCASASAPTR